MMEHSQTTWFQYSNTVSQGFDSPIFGPYPLFGSPLLDLHQILPHLMCNRPLQIVCTVKTMHLNCTQIVLHILENLSTVLIPLCKNKANLLHGPLYFKKVKTTTTTAFSISSTVLNPHNHVTVFNPQPFAPYLKFQVSLLDLSQSDIQIFYLL